MHATSADNWRVLLSSGVAEESAAALPKRTLQSWMICVLSDASLAGQSPSRQQRSVLVALGAVV